MADHHTRLIALMELASDATFDCTGVVACLHRSTNPGELKRLMRDLGWVGFSLITLANWAEGHEEVTSEKWVFLGTEV